MKNVFNFAAVAASIVLGFGLSACSTMAVPLDKNYTPVAGPPATEVESPYQPAMACLRDELAAENAAKQLADPKWSPPTWAVGYFLDRTGKMNAVSDSGTGQFMSQGLATMLMTSVGLIVGPEQQSNMSEEFQHELEFARKLAGRPMRLRLPTYIINGAVDSADFSGGGGVTVNAPATLKYTRHRVMIGFDANVTTMPYDVNEAGIVLAPLRYTKQIVGVETGLGTTSFFGNTLVDFNIGQENRGFIQNTARFMMDVVAYQEVARVTGIHKCDDLFHNAEIAAHISTSGTPVATATLPAPRAQESAVASSTSATKPPALLAQAATVPMPPLTPAPADVHPTPPAPETTPTQKASVQEPTGHPIVLATALPPASPPAAQQVSPIAQRDASSAAPRSPTATPGTKVSTIDQLLEGASGIPPSASRPPAPKKTPTSGTPSSVSPAVRKFTAAHRTNQRPASAPALPESAQASRLRGSVAFFRKACASPNCVVGFRSSQLVQAGRPQGLTFWTGRENRIPFALGVGGFGLISSPLLFKAALFIGSHRGIPKRKRSLL